MSVNVTLSTGQGQGQVAKGHYFQKSHSGHLIHVFTGCFDHIIRCFPQFGRLRRRTFSEGQFKKVKKAKF